MQLFYCKDIPASGFCTLDAEESRHAVRVLRLREGDTINVTDGKGGLYTCNIIKANEKSCVITTNSVISFPLTPSHSPSLPKIHLAVAPTKNPSRMEWLVEKAVEVGVSEITLLDCDHSERSFMKTDRLERIALSAMKQSLHTLLPEIHPSVRLKDWLSFQFSILNSQLKFIAHCEADQPRTPLAAALEPGHNAVVLIGPEGDFSEEEIALALKCGFQPVSLGPSRLRTETAALYAVCAFNLTNDCKK